MFSQIAVLDVIIILAYFGFVFFLAFWVSFRDRKSETAVQKSSTGYFLAGKNMGWFVIGASLFASNIGSEHLVGLAGSGARGDMSAAQFEILASLILLLLGWIFVPFYIKSGVFTMPEFLEKRYSGGARTYLSIISILAYILTKISVTIFAGALVFEVMIGVPFWTGAIIVILATGVYTVMGGLRAVIYTDMMQMFVLIAGAVAVTFFGLQAAGGWDEVMLAISENANPDKESQYFNLWRSMADNDYPWTGILFGAPILGVWYWCTDQFIVQRVLSAKDLSNARKGTIFGGFLKQLPLFIFIIPGIIAFALSTQNTDLLLDSSGNVEYDSALPALVMTYLPAGFKGLVVAGLLAALMSSLSSVFNSCSTLFTIDFYKRYKPDVSEKQLVRVGQIATVVLVVIGLLWIPLMRSMMEGGGLFKYLQSIQAYISPPIAAVFLFGLFFKRINARGALAALWSGFVLGIGRLLIEFLTSGYQTGDAIWNISSGSLLALVVEINFLHFALYLFLICSLILILMSLTAPAQSAAQLELVTYKKGESESKSLFQNNDFWLTMLLIAIVLTIWMVFSPLGLG